jgi:hypothetical protein
MAETAAPEAELDDVTFTLSWRMKDGGLSGELEAVNISNRSVRLSGKPGLTPIGMDDRPLDTDCAVSLEWREPGYVELQPGERASSPVGWGSWDGPPSSGKVIVQWEGGQVEVNADGPRQPTSNGPGTNLHASWFDRVE